MNVIYEEITISIYSRTESGVAKEWPYIKGFYERDLMKRQLFNIDYLLN